MLILDKQIGVTIYQRPRHVTWRGRGTPLERVGYSKHALTCLIGCRLPPLDGYVAVCLVLTIEVYDITNVVNKVIRSMSSLFL